MDNLTFLPDSWKSAHDLLEQYRGAVQGVAGSVPAEIAGQLQQAERACDLEFISEEVPRAIEQGLDSSRRVAKIVRAMKEFSHPDSAEKTATDLNRAVESTITVARNEWKYVSDMLTEFDDQLAAVVCYPSGMGAGPVMWGHDDPFIREGRLPRVKLNCWCVLAQKASPQIQRGNQIREGVSGFTPQAIT